MFDDYELCGISAYDFVVLDSAASWVIGMPSVLG